MTCRICSHALAQEPLPLYNLSGQDLAQEPLPLGHENYNFGRPFLGRHYYIHNLSEPCPGVEKKYINFTPKLPPLEVGDHEIYNFLFPFHTDATYQIWLRLAQ